SAAPPSPRLAAALAGALLAAAVLAAAGRPPETLLVVETRALTAATPRLTLELPPGTADANAALAVLVESSLSHAVEAPAGAPVATLRFVAQPGSAAPAAGPPSLPSPGASAPPATAPPGAWTLRAGVDTAEWAIRRPDVAAAAAHPSPAPWLARVAAERFFGLVFLSRAELPVRAGAGWLVVERDPALPPEAVVHLHRLEVRR
ncbi:MAG TPA: hypothetical protein VF100_09095, partial [Thermoanaerobaculia bacterium]